MFGEVKGGIRDPPVQDAFVQIQPIELLHQCTGMRVHPCQIFFLQLPFLVDKGQNSCYDGILLLRLFQLRAEMDGKQLASESIASQSSFLGSHV